MSHFIFTFLSSFVLCILITPLVRIYCHRTGILDNPDSVRKLHSKATPRLGGVAIYLGFLVPLLVVFFVDKSELAHDSFFLGLVLAITLIFFAGIYDDVWGMRPHVKFFFEFLSASIILVSGFNVDRLSNPLTGDPFSLAPFLSIPITFLWLMGVTNAINFMDGLDGLVAGLAIIISLFTAIVSLQWHNEVGLLLSLALMGSCLGFLFYNFPPASIFLGDSGSLLIGLVLAILSITALTKRGTALTISIPFLLLAIPVLDIIFAVIRRLYRRIPIYTPDREHIHHMLLERFSPRTSLLTLWAISFALGVTGTFVMPVQAWSILLLLIIVIVFTLIWKKGWERLF